MRKNQVSLKLSYILSIWAGCLTMIISFLGGNTPPVIFKRSMISFLLFGILGYVAGWIIHLVAQPKLAFIEEDDDEEGIEDGEAMESL